MGNSIWGIGVVAILTTLPTAHGMAQYPVSGNLPHGLEIAFTWNSQWAARVTSSDGSASFVSVSNQVPGYLIGLRYHYAIDGHMVLWGGIHAGQSSFSFSWNGDQDVLGSFASGDPNSTGFPVEHWGVRGISGGVEITMLVRPKFRMFTAAGGQFEKGSGGASLYWVETTGTGQMVERFRYDAKFNHDNRVMSGLLIGTGAAWTVANANQIRAGLGCKLALDKDVLSGSYLIRTGDNYPMSGAFRSAMNNVFVKVGYVRMWGFRQKPIP